MLTSFYVFENYVKIPFFKIIFFKYYWFGKSSSELGAAHLKYK